MLILQESVAKVITSHKAMQRSHAPTASIAYAFHSWVLSSIANSWQNRHGRVVSQTQMDHKMSTFLLLCTTKLSLSIHFHSSVSKPLGWLWCND